jgi:hypothetical protein
MKVKELIGNLDDVYVLLVQGIDDENRKDVMEILTDIDNLQNKIDDLNK